MNYLYTLLLDGLNEVSREEIKGHVILQMVVAEIIYIMANYKNVRVILTSRSEEKLGGEAKSLYLSGIDHEQIEAFLNDKGVSPARIKKTTQNTQLMETLRIPLFLIMYAELEGEDELLSRGEILHSFFSKTNKGRYSERNRIEIINTELAKETGVNRSERSKDCITPHMLNFILDFIMPQIAWNMAKENEFQIKRTGIKKAVKQILADKTETSFISEYAIEFFGEYLTGEDENIRTTAERIKKIFGADRSEGMDSISSGVLKCLTKQFGLLVTNDYKEYEVLHQHIRDYFAALYHINRLKLAAYINEQGDRDKAIECLSEMGKEPLPGQVLVFIGEALGELHNVPELNEEKNEWIKKEPKEGTERDLINRNFDIFRGISNDDDNYAVWNLFQIMKLVREDLSGLDLSGLDLRRCRANGYKLGNRTFAAKMDYSILSDEFFIPSGHFSSVNSVAYSPDGKYILTASKDNTVRVWDTKTFIVTASEDKTAKVWNAKSFKQISSGTLRGHKRVIKSAVYSPDGKYIVTAAWDGTAKIWDTKTYTVVPNGTLLGHEDWLESAVYSPDGKRIVTASRDGTTKVWDAETLKEVSGGTLACHNGWVSSAVYSPDGKHILAVSYNGNVKVWESKTLKEVPGDRVVGHLNSVNSASYSPDGKFIVMATENKTAQIWDTKTFEAVSGGVLKGHNGAVLSAVYSPDGKNIVTASKDETAKVWNAKTFKEVSGGSLTGHNGWVSSAVYSPDGKNIVTTSVDATAKVWDTKTNKEVYGGTLIGHKKWVRTAAYSPDGSFIVTTSMDGTTKVWDTKTFEELTEGNLRNHKVRSESAVYSPDGNYILTASFDGTVKVWNAKTFKRISGGKELRVCGDVAFTAVYSPDGEQIVTTSFCGPVEVWNAKTFTKMPGGTLFAHKIGADSAVFSPDGKYILTASFDGTAIVLDAKTFEVIHTINNVPGLEIWNVDIRAISDSSYISDETKSFLRNYGAIV